MKNPTTALPFALFAIFLSISLGGTVARASTVNVGTLTPFTGGDAGEGLDLSGNLIYAFNLGGSAQTVQGVNFAAASAASLPAGITTTGGAILMGPLDFDYTGTNGGNAADYGNSADDDALESITTTIWYDNNWTFDLEVTPGTQYQLQLILQEGWFPAQGTTTRDFEISVETAAPSALTLAVDDLILGMETDGAAPAQPDADFGLVYTYTFIAPDDSFRVALDETVGANLAVLAAVTLEELGDDTTAPDIDTLSPLNGAPAVPTYANLVVTFDENVKFGTGNITIKESVGGAVVEAFDVANSTNLLLSGATVTIDPSSNLAGTIGYDVEIAPEAIDDLDGYSFPGIPAATTWSFTTAAADVAPPGVGTVDMPANGASDVSPSGSLALTIDEDVQKGSGNVVIRRVGDDAAMDTIDVTSGNVTVDGAQVTIVPNLALPGMSLYVEIDPGAFLDLTGNPFGGISGPGTWSFTTAAIVLFDDFSTDPNINSEWTEYGYFPPDNTTPIWNSVDGDLNLSKPIGSDGFGLYRTEVMRLPTDPVTLTVKSLEGTDGTWGFLGLMICAVEQPSYIASDDDSYTLRMFPTGPADPTTFTFQVTRTYLDGTAEYILYESPSPVTFSGPHVLEIVRNDSDNYEFLADGVLLYTSGDVAGDLYEAAAKDSLVNYQIVLNGDGAIEATVDDFGILPESGIFAITEIDYDAETDSVTLTWRKSRAASYIAKVSPDMKNWDTDVGDSLTADLDLRPEDPDHLTMTFDLSFIVGDRDELFFRIEEE